MVPNMVSFLLSVNKLDEIQLLLHGLGLGYLTDIMTVSALSYACFMMMLDGMFQMLLFLF